MHGGIQYASQVMKARKLTGAQEVVEKANGDKRVQKMIGKKPPPGKRGRPKGKAKAKNTFQKIKEPPLDETEDHGEDEELQPGEGCQGEGGEDGAGGEEGEGREEGEEECEGGKQGRSEGEAKAPKPKIARCAVDTSSEWTSADPWHVYYGVCGVIFSFNCVIIYLMFKKPYAIELRKRTSKMLEFQPLRPVVRRSPRSLRVQRMRHPLWDLAWASVLWLY